MEEFKVCNSGMKEYPSEKPSAADCGSIRLKQAKDVEHGMQSTELLAVPVPNACRCRSPGVRIESATRLPPDWMPPQPRPAEIHVSTDSYKAGALTSY